MNFLCKAQAYLNSIVSTVNSLAGIVMSDELQSNIEAQYKTVRTLIELEQATSEFITGMELDAELPNAVRISKQKFMNINEHLIKHLEKFQLQGYSFSELITTLKLENTTLKEECNFLYRKCQYLKRNFCQSIPTPVERRRKWKNFCKKTSTPTEQATLLYDTYISTSGRSAS